MRIAQVSTMDTRVGCEDSASIEQIVALLDRELTQLGHDVTVFAAAGSAVVGHLVPTLPGPYGTDGAPDDWRLCEIINLCRAIERSGDFDVIHSHAYLWGLPFDALCPVPLVHTLHIHPYEDTVGLRAMWPHACVAAISKFQWSETPALPPTVVIPHGIDIAQFTFRPQPEDYVCFLGRFIPDKGALTAICVARQLGLRLLLAGPRNEYFDEVIAPEIDGRGIEYLGPVTASGRDALLGGARALLYPIEAPEPFGLVQIEAMMCGTPVVAMRLGAVPEIVEDDVTGFAVETTEEFLSAVPRACALNRERIRVSAERRFSSVHMAEKYLSFYERVIATHPR